MVYIQVEVAYFIWRAASNSCYFLLSFCIVFLFANSLATIVCQNKMGTTNTQEWDSICISHAAERINFFSGRVKRSLSLFISLSLLGALNKK